MKQLNINNPFNNAPIYYIEETESTMKEAVNLSKTSPLSGSVVLAGYQTGGRGRITGRIWESEKDENLLLTIILKKEDLLFNPEILPLLIGLGVVKTLEESYNLSPNIKWPNDILINEKKICGILCEFRKGFYFCGMGLNCNQVDFPQITHDVVSIKSLTGKSLDLAVVLKELLIGLKKSFTCEKWNKELNKRLYKKKKVVLIKGNPENGKKIKGFIKEVSERGHLLFLPENSDIPINVISGEIEYEFN